MYATMDETWQVQIGGRSRELSIKNDEGLVQDRITLKCDGEVLLSYVYTAGNNAQVFQMDGEELELRWINSSFPQRFGVALLRNGEVLASSGDPAVATASATPVIASNLEMKWGITFESTHLISILYWERALGDILRIAVDGVPVYEKGITAAGVAQINVEGRDLAVHWHHESVGAVRAALRAVAIVHEGRVVGHIGPIGSLGLASPSQTVGIRAADDLEVTAEADERLDVLATEEYPIDNRIGGAVIQLSQAISRTASNEVTLGMAAEGGFEVGLDALKLVKAGLSAKLGVTLGHAFGETVSQSNTINFAVPAGDYLVYRVTWRRTRRTGTVRAVVDGHQRTFTYDALFGLSYQVEVLRGDRPAERPRRKRVSAVGPA